MKHTVEVQPDGIGFLCDEDEFVFDAMQKNGQGPVRHGCGGGGCGICKMRVAEGKFSAPKRMSRAHISDAERQQGYVLLCCIKPREDMKIFK